MNPDSAAAPPGIDRSRLIPYLIDNDIIPRGVPVEIELVSAGRSNLTYTLDAGEERLILRRPPLAHVLATAHDMGREYRVISALRTTDVPVPRTRWYCEDEAVIGRPFYVMDRVDGFIYRHDADVESLDASRRRGIGLGMLDTLARLHRVDPDAVGLGDFGRPEGFMARQLRRWTRQLTDSSSRELPGAGTLIAGLEATLPEPRAASIVHGDYRLDNMIVADGEIRAVLDWEMSTLGDPLSDLGMFCLYWDGLPVDTTLLATMFGRVPGFPAREELLERYESQTGTRLEGLSWYLAFAAFKLAVIIEGIYYRGLISTDPHGDTDELGTFVEPLIATGLATFTDGHLG